jgi:hypothetical protein
LHGFRWSEVPLSPTILSIEGRLICVPEPECAGAGWAAGVQEAEWASCGHAVARHKVGATAAVSGEKPLRRFRIKAWPRARVSADLPRLKLRMG